MTNREIRLWYLEQTREIAATVAEQRLLGHSLESIARCAFELRRQARLEARLRMTDPTEVLALERRDLIEYGSTDGPSFEQALERARARGLSGDEVYEEVIRSSMRTSPVTNEQVLGESRPDRG